MSNKQKAKPKRLLSLILSLTMMLSMLPIIGTATASAYTGDGTKGKPYLVTAYDELKSLLEDNTSKYLRLGKNITYNATTYQSRIDVGSGDYVLDLAGYILNYSYSDSNAKFDQELFYIDEGSLTINDSKGNALVKVLAPGDEWKRMFTVANGSLTVNGGDYEINSMSTYYVPDVICVQAGTLTINGGSFTTTGRGVYGQSGAHCTINGGKFLIKNNGAFEHDSEMCGISLTSGSYAEAVINTCIVESEKKIDLIKLNGGFSLGTCLPDNALVSGECSPVGLISDSSVSGSKAVSGTRCFITNGTEESPYFAFDYAMLQNLMATAPASSTTRYIKLMENITHDLADLDDTLSITTAGQWVNLDLNGYDISCTYKAAKSDIYNIFDVKNGRLDISDDEGGSLVFAEKKGIPLYVKEGGSLYAYSGTYYSEKSNAISIDSASEVYINGGTFKSKELNGLCSFDSSGARSKIIINDGSFVTESGGCGGAVFWDGDVTVNGGSFRNNLTRRTSDGRDGIAVIYNPFYGWYPDVTIHGCETLGGIIGLQDGWRLGSDSVVTGINKDGTTYSVTDADAFENAYRLEIGRYITRLDIDGIDAPVAGKLPDTTAAFNAYCGDTLLASDKVDNAGVTWFDWENNKTLGVNDVFEPGHTYMVMVTLNTSGKQGYVFSTADSKPNISVNGNKGFLWLSNQKTAQCCYNFETLRVPLSGTITLPNAYYNTILNPELSDNLQAMSEEGKLIYEWQRGDDPNSTWEVISGATERNYTPVKTDVGKYIRLVVTNDEGLEYIASNMVQVVKKQINNTKPSSFTPIMSNDNTYIIIVGAKRYQEYLISYSSTAPESDSSQWNNAIRPDSSNSEQTGNILAMKMDCEPNQYVFIHTRIFETDYTVAGLYTETKSVYTGDTTAIKGISLGYSNLDMTAGEVKLIEATPIPSNAENWSGGEWYVNGTGAELYLDEACTTRYYRSVHGSRTELYLKATAKNNDITVGVEKTIGYNSVVRGTMMVNVTDKDGNYKLRQMVFPTVNLHSGDSVTVDISTYPNPSIIEGVPSIVPINLPEDIVISINSTAKTARITANPGVATGSYLCGVYIDGQETSNASFISVNVIEDEIPVDTISVSPENVTLAPGMSYKFNLTVNPSNACVSDTVKWEYYSDSSSITVDSAGTVKVADNAKGGVSTVFKATYGGKSTTFKVTVATPIENVRVDVTNPVAGELPTAPTLATTGGIVANSLTYTWYDTWGTYTEMNPTTDCFTAGKTYRLCMELEAADGYIFTNSVVAKLGIAGGVDTCVVSNNTVTRLYFYKDFTIPSESTGVTVSGTVNSFGSDTDNVMLQLIEEGASEAAYEAVVNGNNASYSIEDVEPGAYTMKVMKKNNAIREYTVIVDNEAVIQDAEIFLLGDVNMSGNISIADAIEVQKGIAGIISLTGYKYKLSDVNKDGNVSIADAIQIQKYIAGIIENF